MAIGLLGIVGRPAVTDPPEVSAMIRVAMTVPQELHPVIDDDVRARPAHQVRDRERMHDSGRCEQIAGGRGAGAVAWRRGPPFVVEIVETAERIDDVALEKREQAVGLLKEPGAMAGQVHPPGARRVDGEGSHGERPESMLIAVDFSDREPRAHHRQTRWRNSLA